MRNFIRTLALRRALHVNTRTNVAAPYLQQCRAQGTQDGRDTAAPARPPFRGQGGVAAVPQHAVPPLSALPGAGGRRLKLPL
jgi:hypothetical protein